MSPQRPQTGMPVPDTQADALRRRQALDEQQRSFQGAVPHPHIFRRRPPG